MATYTKPYRVVYLDSGQIICVIRNDAPQTHTAENCAEFDAEDDMDEFIELRDLWEADV